MSASQPMKGIILAGGTGSRLYPLTKVTNKHLLPVGAIPMIYHAIERLVEADIREILIVTGLEHMGAIVNCLGSGKDFDCRFTYKVQDEAGGIAQALALAENFVGQSPMAVILGDNLFEDPLKDFLPHYTGVGAHILLKEVSDPQRFGVATLEGPQVVKITEKPPNPDSPYAVTGIYFYDARVFDIIRTLTPSARNELEITDVNNAYIQQGQMSYDLLQGWWSDAGTFPSYQAANAWFSKHSQA